MWFPNSFVDNILNEPKLIVFPTIKGFLLFLFNTNNFIYDQSFVCV